MADGGEPPGKRQRLGQDDDGLRDGGETLAADEQQQLGAGARSEEDDGLQGFVSGDEDEEELLEIDPEVQAEVNACQLGLEQVRGGDRPGWPG
jgi:hypothetical protein